MPRGAQVHNIIHTLTRGEKRQFKLQAYKYEKSGKHITAQLFDVIEGMKEWDDAIFRKKIKNTGISKNTSVHINTLIAQLLDILRTKEVKNNKVFQINQLVEESMILAARGESDLALKRIGKAKLLAEQAELYEKLLEILMQERSIQFNRMHKTEYNDFRLQYYKKIKDAYQKLENQSDYLNLVEDVFFLFYTIGYPHDPAEKTQYSEIINDPLLSDISNALTSHAQSSFYFVHFIYHQSRNELKEARDIALQQVAVYDGNKKFSQIHINTYISILNNLAMLEAQLESFEEFNRTLAKWRAIPQELALEDKNVEQRIFELSYGVELDYYITNDRIDRIAPVIATVEEKIKSYEKSGVPFVSFLNLALHVAICHYRLGDMEKAHQWVKQVLDHEGSRTSIYNILYALILDTSLHFLLGDFKYLKYRIPTVQKYFKKHKQLIPINELFFDSLLQLMRAKNTVEADRILDTYRSVLTGFPESLTNHFYLKYIDIEGLIERRFGMED